MPSTMLSPETPPRLPRVPGVVLVLARTGANSLCRGPPAVVLAGVAFEVPGVRNVARAGSFAETPHGDELVADRAVALHDQIVRLRLRAHHPVFDQRDNRRGKDYRHRAQVNAARREVPGALPLARHDRSRTL